MNTMQAEYRTDIARLAEDMAKRDAEAAKREVQKTERDATERDPTWRECIAAATGIMSSADWAQTVVILIFLILFLMLILTAGGAWVALIVTLAAS